MGGGAILAAFSVAVLIFLKYSEKLTVFSKRFSSAELITTTALLSSRLIFLAFSSATKMQAIIEVRLRQIIAVTA